MLKTMVLDDFKQKKKIAYKLKTIPHV